MKTLSGRDSEEYHREVIEKLKGVKPFKNDEEFLTHARGQWEARKQAEAPNN